MNLGQLIIQARKNKGLSQEQLAEDSGINLRTLQRIEKGETYPHGGTLKKISEALDIPLIDLINSGFAEDYSYIKVMHFVTLTFVLLPLGNILLPLIFWIVKKNQVKYLTFFARKLLNFQITWSIITYLPLLIYFILREGSQYSQLLEKFSTLFSWIILPLLYVFNTVYLIIALILIRDRQRNFFPIAIPFLR